MATILFEDPRIRKLLFGQLKESRLNPAQGAVSFEYLVSKCKVNSMEIAYLHDLKIAHHKSMCTLSKLCSSPLHLTDLLGSRKI